MLELSCLEVYLQPNLTYPLSSLNFSLMTFLQPVKETQTRMAIFLNHSSFQNFIRICQDITNEFKMCSLCLACEFKGNIELISQEQTSKGKCKGKVRIKFIKDKWPYSVKKKKGAEKYIAILSLVALECSVGWLSMSDLHTRLGMPFILSLFWYIKNKISVLKIHQNSTVIHINLMIKG